MILIGLPVDSHRSDKPSARSGLAIHASEAGLCLQTFYATPLGKRININVSFPRGTEFESFRVETEIVWKDVYFWEGWEQYQYALKFLEMSDGLYLKLKRLLCRLCRVEETPFQIKHRGVSV